MDDFKQDKPALYRRYIWARFSGKPDHVLVEGWRMRDANMTPVIILGTLNAGNPGEWSCEVNARGDFEFRRREAA